METFSDWVQFSVAAAVVILLLAIVILLLIIVLKRSRQKKPEGIKLTVKPLRERFERQRNTLLEKTLSPDEWNKRRKEEAKAHKKRAKDGSQTSDKPRAFVLDFQGDTRASAVENFRDAVTAILDVAQTTDEVVVRLTSPGGQVHAYGLAASQLARIRTRQVPLTICVDNVAASGGYMMAAVANRIVAAPFAIVGSIGVVSEFPNIHRFLKNRDVDYLQLTAGEHKRTVGPMGEITEEGKAKYLEQLQKIHDRFKEHIASFRPQVDINAVATGEFWLASHAKELGLVDDIGTSDDYLVSLLDKAEVFLVEYEESKNWKQRLMERFATLPSHQLLSWEPRLEGLCWGPVNRP